jgi:hypothetical protein
MNDEGRLIDPANISRWPGIICYIKPKRGTPQELERNVRRMYEEFYSLRSIFSRLPFPSSRADMASWMVNLSQRKIYRGGPHLENFENY